jgi:2-dehydro-3-deoxy-D-arabinonate dehydratase
MKLFNTSKGILLQRDRLFWHVKKDWDALVNQRDLYHGLELCASQSASLDEATFEQWTRNHLLAPIGKQEVWAAGVTYLRSRDARMDESRTSGGADFYDKVYIAERPELFFKATARRVSPHNSEVYIRKDSSWNVPEPELTVYINSLGEIQGYGIGNDMSSRSIEGENPLYLPQAKVYEKSAALGPCLYVPETPLPKDTSISIKITRNGNVQFEDSIQLNKMKRSLPELASYLYRECNFPDGCWLMTGTGMVPPAEFTLQVADEVDITIEHIGVLHNWVSMGN